jgi:hypothetical protein
LVPPANNASLYTALHLETSQDYSCTLINNHNRYNSKSTISSKSSQPRPVHFSKNYLAPLKETYIAIMMTTDLMLVDIAEIMTPIHCDVLINIPQNLKLFGITNI